MLINRFFGDYISFSVKVVVSILATTSKRSLRSKPCFVRSTFQIITHFQMHPTHLTSSQGEGHQTNLILSSAFLIYNEVKKTNRLGPIAKSAISSIPWSVVNLLCFRNQITFPKRYRNVSSCFYNIQAGQLQFIVG